MHAESEIVLPLSVQTPYLPLRGSKVLRFMGGSIGSRIEISETLAQAIPMVTRLHQSNGYTKRELPGWRVQKCIVLLSADTVLSTVRGSKVPRLMGGSIRPRMEMCGNFGSTNPHGTAFAPKQWLYQKEATGMESRKFYCPNRCRHRTYFCVETK